MHHHFGHAACGSIARALKDDVFHLSAAQMLNPLLAENPGDGIGNIALAAAIRPDNGSYAITSEDYFGVIGEGLESSDF